MANKKATRESYGEALALLADENKDVVVLDADLSKSTKTELFQKKAPDRFFDCGIAEGNMIGIAAGLAAAGKIPFASSFAMFAAGRAFEQIRNSVGYPHLNVKICGRGRRQPPVHRGYWIDADHSWNGGHQPGR